MVSIVFFQKQITQKTDLFILEGKKTPILKFGNFDSGDASLDEKNKELRQLALENNIAFLPSFLEIYPEFQENLLRINPTLINSDIEFCALLKLKLNSQ